MLKNDTVIVPYKENIANIFIGLTYTVTQIKAVSVAGKECFQMGYIVEDRGLKSNIPTGRLFAETEVITNRFNCPFFYLENGVVKRSDCQVVEPVEIIWLDDYSSSHTWMDSLLNYNTYSKFILTKMARGMLAIFS